MPDEITPVREGSRWRYKRPNSDEVAEWFSHVPLDGGMDHDTYVSGVVLIAATEKVKVQVEREDGRLSTEQQEEMVFTPYVRVDTRIAYFRALAAANSLVAVIEPVEVPRITDGDNANINLPTGFWWHKLTHGSSSADYLCCTMRVALYAKDAWEEPVYFRDGDQGPYRENPMRAVREGVATKQVLARTDDANMLAKAETGAVGRALGMAGILVVGTGIATAEDMAELRDTPLGAPGLPSTTAASETPEQLKARMMTLSSELAAKDKDAWNEEREWFLERSQAEGWSSLEDAPIEVRRAVASRIERRLKWGGRSAGPTPNSSSDA